MARNEMVEKILKSDYHRNGVGGNGFTISLFEPSKTYVDHKGVEGPSDMAFHEGPFLAIQLPEYDSDGKGVVSMNTAIIALDDLFHWSQMRQEEYDALPSYQKSIGAWRGDMFASEIQKMVEEKQNEKYADLLKKEAV